MKSSQSMFPSFMGCTAKYKVSHAELVDVTEPLERRMVDHLHLGWGEQYLIPYWKEELLLWRMVRIQGRRLVDWLRHGIVRDEVRLHVLVIVLGRHEDSMC